MAINQTIEKVFTLRTFTLNQLRANREKNARNFKNVIEDFEKKVDKDSEYKKGRVRPKDSGEVKILDSFINK